MRLIERDRERERGSEGVVGRRNRKEGRRKEKLRIGYRKEKREKEDGDRKKSEYINVVIVSSDGEGRRRIKENIKRNKKYER